MGPERAVPEAAIIRRRHEPSFPSVTVISALHFPQEDLLKWFGYIPILKHCAYTGVEADWLCDCAQLGFRYSDGSQSRMRRHLNEHRLVGICMNDLYKMGMPGIESNFLALVDKLFNMFEHLLRERVKIMVFNWDNAAYCVFPMGIDLWGILQIPF
eukprot:s2534_g5.t1